jgi:phage gp45-like
VRSAAGDLELSVVLTPEGPVLKLRGVRLQIDSTESVDLSCKQFNVHTQQGINLSSDGEFRLRTQGQTHLDAELINLNGGDRSTYPDEANAARIMAELEPALADQERKLREEHEAAMKAYNARHDSTDHTCGPGCEHAPRASN